ncbi:hypothetical protein J2T17_004325 [Paenibacillus mucilaginosus]|uniref:hypothetical protein n=1 Tax=Paenibacillus mucilaginosus TaxID=61624 RepID=UPI003D231CA5
MRYKKIIASIMMSSLLLTGVTAANASNAETSISKVTNVTAQSSTVTVVKQYNTEYYKWYSDTPDKVWHSNGSNAAGWLYRTDGYQSNGYWYIQYTGTLYNYD